MCIARHGSIELLAEERKAIMDLLPRGTSAEETEAALSILSQLNTRVTAEEDISDQDQVCMTTSVTRTSEDVNQVDQVRV